MGDALIVKDECARALMFLEPWTMEWPITTLLAFLLVSSLTLNLILVEALREYKDCAHNRTAGA